MSDWAKLTPILGDTKWSKLRPAAKFLAMWQAYGHSEIDTEVSFRDDRGFRLDFAWPSLQVGVEIHGFGFGHQAQQQVAVDCAKMRAAIECGWIVIPFTTRCIQSRDNCYAGVHFVCRILERRANHGNLRTDVERSGTP